MAKCSRSYRLFLEIDLFPHNANFIVEALGRFMNIFKPKLPVMFQQEWFSARDSAMSACV